MLRIDHLTVVAPSLAEGVEHVCDCIGVDVPFGQRHLYMGTYNHLLQLGGQIYLEIVALDPEAAPPAHARWFGLDDQEQVRRDWDAGCRLRSWVARSDDIDGVLTGRAAIFGRKVALPQDAPSFDFAIRDDGALPLDGAVPLIIDRRGKPRSMASVADRGARFRGFSLAHPDPDMIAKVMRDLAVDLPPTVSQGAELRYRAQIDTPSGLRELT